MLFGFGWAVLGGFLLTASKNWVKIRGLHGFPLAIALLLWLVERAAVLSAGALPGWLWWPSVNAFLLFVAGYVVWSLVRYRKQDSFSDNAFFLLILPLFLLSKNLLLNGETFAIGWTMALGLFRIAFVVMFERTFPPFMKAAAGIHLRPLPRLGLAIKVLLVIAVFEALLPPAISGAILLAAATLLAIRLALWRPIIGIATFSVAIMYVGYLGLITHLVLEALRVQGIFFGLGAVATHTFSFFCLGGVAAAMMIRVSQGHTGRALVFTRQDRLAFALLGLGAYFRLVATQLWPYLYLTWITWAGISWAACFALLGIRLVPFLWRARIDGKEH